MTAVTNPPEWRHDTVLPLPPEVVANAWAVDAACSGNPGPMEYQAIDLATGAQVFHFGPMHGTNNIGEFLAIVHALALMEQQGIRDRVIYSDSYNAILWVRKKQCKTKLERNAQTEGLYRIISVPRTGSAPTPSPCPSCSGRPASGATFLPISAVSNTITSITYTIMDTIKKDFASKLLEIKAIKLQPQNPFTWASGWKSPFYCDNRKTLSFTDVRSYVKLELAHAILAHFPQATAVAGVATGAIAQGAMVADELNMPFCYVRSKAKDHGMGNLIEGELPVGAKVVVVEDLISTGGSSLKAVEALRQAGFEVVGMVASYTYGFAVAEEAFAQAGVKLVTLTDYEHVVERALETGYIQDSDVELLHRWRKDPAHYQV